LVFFKRANANYLGFGHLDYQAHVISQPKEQQDRVSRDEFIKYARSMRGVGFTGES
jgi:hypothetical protein